MRRPSEPPSQWRRRCAKWITLSNVDIRGFDINLSSGTLPDIIGNAAPIMWDTAQLTSQGSLYVVQHAFGALK
jgi:hypothetical protein